MLVRQESESDFKAISRLLDSAFGLPNCDEAKLASAFRQTGHAIPDLSLVAEIDGSVIGHIMGSRAQLENRDSVALAPLAVIPSQQGKGFGSALVKSFIETADALGFGEILVLGDQAYYSRFGFEPAIPLGVNPPDPDWNGHFQLLRLRNWNPVHSAMFTYAPPFGLN